MVVSIGLLEVRILIARLLCLIRFLVVFAADLSFNKGYHFNITYVMLPPPLACKRIYNME